MTIKRVFSSSINADHAQAGMRYAFRKIFGDGNFAEFDYLELKRQHHDEGEINRMLVDQARSFKPDWVWLQLQDTNVIQPHAIQEIRKALPKCVVTHWTGDCRPSVSAYLGSIGQSTHLTLVSSVGQLPLFRAAGAQEAAYLQIGLDYEEDVLGSTRWRPDFNIPDVVFCGGYYGGIFPGTKDRVEAIETVRNAGIPIGIVGRGWPGQFPVIGQCGVKDQHHVWKRARVCLSVNHFNDIELYYSDRQLISMASGTPVVCRYVPGLEKEFVHGKHCLWYRHPNELVTYVSALLKNPAEAAELGRCGKEEVVRNHTWEARYRKLLPTIERIAGTL